MFHCIIDDIYLIFKGNNIYITLCIICLVICLYEVEEFRGGAWGNGNFVHGKIVRGRMGLRWLNALPSSYNDTKTSSYYKEI